MPALFRRFGNLFLHVLCFSPCFLGSATLADEPRDPSLQIAIPAGTLADALDRLGDQSGVQIMYEPALAQGIQVPAINGKLTVRDALAKLLSQTGLKADRVNDRTVVLKRVVESNERSTHNREATEPVAANLEEITVTARKREERLQDVPASIAAASEQTIRDLNIVSLSELDAIAPGLTFVTNPSRFGSGPSIALRGVSTQTQSAGVQDSVGIVIDGVVISRAKPGAFPDLGDTERVEVLRGPQGTLFGKNASAGVISIITKDPTPTFVSDLAVGYSTYDNKTARASVSGPLVDDVLLGRLSAYTKSRDGYVDNIFDGSHWEADAQKSFRGKLLFTPTSVDKLKLSADYVNQHNDAGANIVRSFSASTPQYVRDALGSIVGFENDRINAHSLGDNCHVTGGASLEWDRDVGENTLTTISAYRHFKQRFHAGTYTWLTPSNAGDQLGGTRLNQYSQEVRIASTGASRLQYVAGVFLLSDEVVTAIADPDTIVVGTPTHIGRNYVSDVDTLNYAGFAEANANLTDRLTLTAGVRLTREQVDVAIVGYPIRPGQTRLGHPEGRTEDSRTADNLSWRLGGQWHLDSERMFYVSAATGYKGPGFNVNTSVLGDAQPVSPEKSLSYEAGIKSQYFNRRLTLNLNAYRSTFENFQTQGYLLAPGLPVGSILLLNAKEMRTQGFEAEMRAAPTDTTEVSLNAAYIDAQFEEFPNAPCYFAQPRGVGRCSASGVQNLAGAPLPNSPRWSFNAFAKQEFPIPGTSWRGFLTADYSWRDRVQWNLFQSPDGIENAYGLLGASASLRSENDRIDVKLYARNLTDKFHTSGIVAGETNTQFLPPDYRRIVGIDATFRY